jgi:hypothetical protein
MTTSLGQPPPGCLCTNTSATQPALKLKLQFSLVSPPSGGQSIKMRATDTLADSQIHFFQVNIRATRSNVATGSARDRQHRHHLPVTALERVHSTSQSELLHKKDYQLASPLPLACYYSSFTRFPLTHKRQTTARKNARLEQGRTPSRAGPLAVKMRVPPVIQQFMWLPL